MPPRSLAITSRAQVVRVESGECFSTRKGKETYFLITRSFIKT